MLVESKKAIPFGGKVPVPPRDGFNFREWQKSLGKASGTKVVGMSFFRASYDEEIVPEIWKELIGEFLFSRLLVSFE